MNARNKTDNCSFNFRHYEESLKLAKRKGYSFSTLGDFDSNRGNRLLVLLRHDLDNPQVHKALDFARIESKLGIKATYFVRVHSDGYNPFGFKTYSVLKKILELGHEIGLHYEHLDFCAINNETPDSIIVKEKKLLELIFDIRIKGIAGHRSFSGIQNWDFWKDKDYKNFGFDYDAYEDKFMEDTLYIDDSLGKWKDGKCICQYIRTEHLRLYVLTHPFYWYHKAFQLEI
jgi:hypothetical protein